MSKPKFVKPLLIGCACAIPVGLVVGLSVNWDHRQFISCVGSSGVKPFVEAFGKEFTNSNRKVDVQVESGGTTFAVEEVAKGFANVGNASNNPFYTINKDKSGYRDQWKNKKTFTLGFEGLVILYKMPANLSSEAQENFDIVINTDNILKLFAVFSGFDELKSGEAWKTEYGSFYYFMTDESKLHLNANDVEICKETQIIPFVRSGGNTAANSSIAFTYYSNLANFEDMSKNQQDAFKGGQYGNDREYYETEESNARAWELFNNQNKPGSMVYLTTGFVKNQHNQDEIKRLGYRLAGYQGSHYSKAVYLEKTGDLDQICTKDGYNWYRPINCMIDLDNQLSKGFIEKIYTTNLYESIMKDNGAKPLTTAQKDSMAVDGEMFNEKASDLALEEIRKGTDFAKTYGAEERWD